jgi:kumamolisin
MSNQVEVTLILRPPEGAQGISERLLAGTYDSSQTKQSDIAADPSDIQAVAQFAVEHHLQILKSDAVTRSVRVAGSVAAIEKAFGIRSGNAQKGTVQSLNYKGPVELPAALKKIVIAVLGLDQTPIARHHAQ